VTRLLPRAVLAAAGVLLVVVTIFTLQRDTTRILGTNGVARSAFVVSVRPDQRACETVAVAPAGTRAIRMTVGVYHDPRARLRADAGTDEGGRVVAARDGELELPLTDSANASRICITNLGTGRVELAGTATDPGSAATVDATPAEGVFGLLYLKGQAPDWRERVGNVLARVGYAKGLPGGAATGALALVLLIGTLGGALALSWRTLRP
jgi:hypothetical protein